MVTRAVPSTTIQCSDAVDVALQRQRRARMHHDALDLEAAADGEALEPAPGPVVAREGLRPARAALGLERRDRLLHLLRRATCRRPAPRRGMATAMMSSSPMPTSSSSSALRAQQRVVGSRSPWPGPTAPRRRRRGPISRQTASQPPRSDQRAGKGHDRQVARLLHHRVVDRDVLGLRPGRRRQPQEAQIGLAPRPPPPAPAAISSGACASKAATIVAGA